ncbi:PKD domain-containing protein [Algibacter luteus]|uniref:T9SS type A sorting domain-containing protein n=1 Tax=Algibacter luteus TaxID=1178825 RepID=UPI0025941C39|nr:PKD domain-containing protein [Algibacter luteus]WJJ95711.1 PKD domain-containing protein [Algibacter luteus]
MKKITLLLLLMGTTIGFAQNLFTDGTFDNPSAWTVIQQNGNNNATAVIAGGVATFDDVTQGNWGSEGHVAIYKAFTVPTTGWYEFDADVTTNGLDQHWFEVHIGTAVPVDGVEYNATKILTLHSWDCGATTNTYSGSMIATGCQGLDGKILLDAGTTYYYLVRTGGITWGTGVILDNVTMVAVVAPPVANFTEATSESNLMATFTNTSTDATSYSWDFGDGSTSTDVNPVHTYAYKGQYIVTLTATSTAGSNETTKEIFVGAVSTPISEFDFDFSSPTPLRNESLLDYVEAGGVATASGVNDDWWSQIKYIHNAGIDLSSGDRGFSIDVNGPRTSTLTIKVESGGTEHAVTADYTTPNVWQTLTFDFSSFSSTNNTKIAVFFDIQTNFDAGVDPAQNVFQIDDYAFGEFASLSTKDFKIEGLATYPNPTTDTWNISTKNQVINSIEVFNILGKRVLDLRPNGLSAEVDASNLNSGIYITKITTELGTQTKKLIKH